MFCVALLVEHGGGNANSREFDSRCGHPYLKMYPRMTVNNLDKSICYIINIFMKVKSGVFFGCQKIVIKCKVAIFTHTQWRNQKDQTTEILSILVVISKKILDYWGNLRAGSSCMTAQVTFPG